MVKEIKQFSGAQTILIWTYLYLMITHNVSGVFKHEMGQPNKDVYSVNH